MALLIRPMTRNAAQMRRPAAVAGLGMCWPCMTITRLRISAASTTRQTTMVKVGRSWTAISTKKNDPPQRIDRMISDSQLRQSMTVLIVAVLVRDVALSGAVVWVMVVPLSGDGCVTLVPAE